MEGFRLVYVLILTLKQAPVAASPAHPPRLHLLRLHALRAPQHPHGAPLTSTSSGSRSPNADVHVGGTDLRRTGSEGLVRGPVLWTRQMGSVLNLEFIYK